MAGRRLWVGYSAPNKLGVVAIPAVRVEWREYEKMKPVLACIARWDAPQTRESLSQKRKYWEFEYPCASLTCLGLDSNLKKLNWRSCSGVACLPRLCQALGSFPTDICSQDKYTNEWGYRQIADREREGREGVLQSLSGRFLGMISILQQILSKTPTSLFKVFGITADFGR